MAFNVCIVSELDDWLPEYVAILKKVGNLTSKNVWEGGRTGFHPDAIDPTSSREKREAFIRDKYEKRKFLAPIPPKYGNDLSK